MISMDNALMQHGDPGMILDLRRRNDRHKESSFSAVLGTGILAPDAETETGHPEALYGSIAIAMWSRMPR